MKRLDISRLRKNRNIFLKLGFVLSLSLMALAFNYTVYDHNNNNDGQVKIEEDDLSSIEITRTPPEQKRQLPPPRIEASEILDLEDLDIDPEPIPEPIDTVVHVNPTPMPDPGLTNYAPTPPPKPKELPPVVEPSDDDLPFDVVEEMPRFPGCESEGLSKNERKACAEKAMMTFIGKHLKYPKMAQEMGVEGTVVVKFIIERDGTITSPDILKQPGAGTGKEVLRILKKMPNWIPGRQRGRPVRVIFNLPVKFKLL